MGPSNTQIESFDDLPLGLSPVIAQALADDLPDNFHLQAIKGGYQADNPAHELTTTFTISGPQMAIGGETWGLTPTGLGCGSAVQALSQGASESLQSAIDQALDELAKEWGVEL